MLQLKNITKDYPTASETVHALRGINLAFRKREFVSILGPSGCGKTTLLNIIGGLDHYTSGDLVIAGKSTHAFKDRDWDVYRNHRVGFIFQSYNLIPHQTVLGNVELALTIAGIGKEERTRRAKAVLDRVGLKGKYNQRPNQLSGGQCQRVAIARALVNDPEILLADEPTGALDTVTSVQIMDLIREIAGERLVIMVTHNPELAARYSTRIIRLLDGRVTEDTRPFSFAEEKAEMREEEKKERDAAPTDLGKEGTKKPKEKARMSFFTAFRLSARNLFSKRGRTAMVGIAGSIGIIGIAMVLAFSAGIKGYVASMQDDMLSGNPITVTEKTYDLNALTSMMDRSDKEEIIKHPNRVYINSLVAYLAKTGKNIDSMVIENDLTEAYVNYVKAMPKEYYSAMLLDYGIDVTNNIYTEFSARKGGDTKKISVSALTNIYMSIISETDFAKYATYATTIVPAFEQMPDNKEYIASQYDIRAGHIAEGAGEVMLVLDKNDRLSDLLLARIGYFAQDEFLEIINKATGDGTYDEALYRSYFTYDELLGKTFTWYPNDDIFGEGVLPGSFTYRHDATGYEGQGKTLKVVGILTRKENVSYGSLSSGIYYTKALTDTILEENADSKIVTSLRDSGKDSIPSGSMNGVPFGITYTYEYLWNGETKTATGYVGSSLSMQNMMSAFGSMTPGSSTSPGAGGTGGASGLSDLRYLSLRGLGGVSLANDISIYPVSFESKDLVTGYLDAWNNAGDLTVNGATLSKDDRANVTYTDTLSLVINIINTMIDIISYALIAFTSISLVVSTVMIGIITYVSVVERIKEIGVIRSLGGRKKDVSHLFNAETFIIGTLAGLFGVLVTYLVSAVVNLILYPLIGIPNIAALPIGQAGLLVLLSILLTLISGLIPASSAARKDPVVALRTE